MARADGRQAKKGKPRGPASPAQVVEVCRVLHLAGRPLTRAEIAKEWAARGNSGFLSEAQRAYKQHKEAHDPTWLEGKGERWGKSAQAEAWQWWVNRSVRTSCQSNRITLTTGFGDRATFVPNEEHPPTVTRLVTHTERQFFDPDADRAEDARHTAGMRYLQQVDEAIAAVRASRLAHKDRVIDTLEQGRIAISKHGDLDQ